MAKAVNIAVLKGSREAVIGKVSGKDDEKVLFESPRIVILQQGPDGNPGIQFVPYPFPLADYFLNDWDGEAEISYDETIIVYDETKVMKEVIKAYLQSISPIAIPEEASGQSVVTLR